MRCSLRVMPLKLNLAHQGHGAFGGVDLDLGRVLPQDPAGHVLRGGAGLAVAWPIRDPGAP